MDAWLCRRVFASADTKPRRRSERHTWHETIWAFDLGCSVFGDYIGWVGWVCAAAAAV